MFIQTINAYDLLLHVSNICYKIKPHLKTDKRSTRSIEYMVIFSNI